MNNIVVIFFFFVLGGALWSVSQHFVEAELTAKWYWTAYSITIAVLLYVFSGYVLSRRGAAGKKSNTSMSLYSKVEAMNEKENKQPFSSLFMVIVGLACSQAVYGLLQWAGICAARNGFGLTGSFDNPAGFASALAFSVPFALALWTTRPRWMCWIVRLALAVIVLAVIASESRAGMVSIAVIGVAFLWMKVRRYKKVVYGGMAIALAALLLTLYFYKKDSADGRMLIWQCTWQMIKDKPVLGYGPGGFKANYMNYQAQYFRENPGEHGYMMLADDVKRPFNEYLWIVTDYGLVGGAVLFLAILGVVTLWLRRPVSTSRIAAMLCLLAIAVFSMFSYPFTYPHTLILGVCSLGILLMGVVAVPVKVRNASLAFCTLGLCVLSVFAVKRMYAELQWCRIANLSLCGQTEKVLPVYEELCTELSNKPLFLYNYAAELNVSGRYEESIRIGKQCEARFADYFTQLLLADNYKKLKEYEKACKHWMLASEMCPNRFRPLYEMYVTYQETGDVQRAQQLGDIIVNKPIKVESMEIKRMIEKVRISTTHALSYIFPYNTHTFPYIFPHNTHAFIYFLPQHSTLLYI